MNGRVILASSDIGPLAEQLDGGTEVVFVPTAANGLADFDAIVEPVRRLLDRSGARWREVDLEQTTDELVEDSLVGADIVLVGGGNPYRLLDAARRTRFGAGVRTVLERGGTYCGISAGAMLLAPSLEPLRGVAPFPPPPEGADLDGLGLVDLLVLPHTDREGRRAKHAAALANFGRDHQLLALRDGECVIVDSDGWRLRVRAGLDLRVATTADAGPITELFVEAGRVGWADFLSPEQLAQVRPEPDTWAGRIEAAAPGDVVVAVDPEGVAGFIWVRACEDDDLTAPVGEVATFYTHPRVWRSGVGQRLMAYGLDRLRAMGYDECVLWTEERNERPRRIYATSGWSLDGTSRTRDFHGFPITEIRHRLAL